jgi:hypothetical protein
MSIADTGRFWEILVIPILQILEDSGKYWFRYNYEFNFQKYYATCLVLSLVNLFSHPFYFPEFSSICNTRRY